MIAKYSQAPEKKLSLLIPKHKEDEYLNENLDVLTFSDSFEKNGLYLFFAYKKIDPSEVVIVYGNDWYHENILKLLELWNILLSKNPKIIRCSLGENFCPVYNYRAISFRKSIFAYLLIFTCLILTLFFLDLKIFLGTFSFILFSEIILKIYKSRNTYDNKANQNGKIGTYENGITHTCPHEVFGWINKPSFKGFYESYIPSQKDWKLYWEYTHNENGNRITALDESKFLGKPLIACMGCSITYGHSINNSETYPFLLQEKHNKYRVQNYGVGSYSLYQILLKLEKIIESGTPKYLILGFHQELEKRCTNSYDRRMYWMNFKSPSCTSKKGKLKMYSPQGYDRFLFTEQLTSIELLEYSYNRLKFAGRNNSQLMRNTNEHLLLKIKHLCDKNNIRLLILCVDISNEYYSFFDKHAFHWVISGVRSTMHEWTNAPFDGHPGTKAHQRYADCVISAIDKFQNNRRVMPDMSDLNISQNESNEKTTFIYQHF